ncbi:MAG: DUF4129 domain-containing protein [Chloroflexi bacterium]|nr:MAG: DUF4129 domain-containing protein [Chloroflexota bacterium]
MNPQQRYLFEAKSVVLLAALLIMSATWAIGATGWAPGMNILSFIGLGVILVGLLIVRSVLPGWLAHLFSLIIGAGWSFWVTSRLLPPTYTWIERWQNLSYRLGYWYLQVVQGGTSYDNLMFILQMGFILWVMGYLALWLIFRSEKVWAAVIPGGVILLINLYYAPNDITWWFLIYLLLALLLVVRFTLVRQERIWRAEGVFFRPDVGFDFLRDGIIFSVLVVLVSWFLPPPIEARTVLFEEFQGEWQEIQSEWNRLFANLNYRQNQSTGVFGQSLALGGPRTLTRDPVMDVKLEGGPGRYWRAAVYDQYTGDGWRSTDYDSTDLEPGEPLSLPQFEARVPVTQTYTFYRDGATVLYAMSNPVRIDRAAKVFFHPISGEQVLETPNLAWSTFGAPYADEILYIRSHAAVDTAESYQVVSLTSQATVDQLRQAGTDYPDWITERYLQLPTITERTRQLAREITSAYDNPFDKAQAIERYLRANLRYNEKINVPPPGVDKVDYILFTLKEAYCDYYATSMIVMLRSLGIPARLAAGFAQGQFDSTINGFHVVNADAHSWVEVYFPRYGWIEFEPTAAQPLIIRPTDPNAEGSLAGSLLPQENDAPGADEPDKQENIPIDDEAIAPATPGGLVIPWFGGGSVTLPFSAAQGRTMAVAGGVLAGLSGLGWWVRRLWRKPARSVEELYRRMVWLARWMGQAKRPWQTPYEHAARLQRSLPDFQAEIKIIADSYVHYLFSPHREQTAGQLGQGIQAWERLRPVMLKEAVRRRLRRR